ncbi:MAG: hypothetical protein AAFY51_12695 [Pseudomonadota bacterium]
MARSVAIIGAGQIGYAAARAFQSEGWDVRVLARSKPVWLFDGIVFELHILGEHRAPSADVVLDTIAFDEADPRASIPQRSGATSPSPQPAFIAITKGVGLRHPTLAFPSLTGP